MIRLRESTTHARRRKSRWTVCGLLARKVACSPDVAGVTCSECAPRACRCGCGTLVPVPGRRYVHGHNRRHALPPDVEAAIRVIRAGGPDACRHALDAIARSEAAPTGAPTVGARG